MAESEELQGTKENDGTVYYTTHVKVPGSKHSQIRVCKKGPRTKNLKGMHFGRLVVEKFLGKNGYDVPVWGCLCECGNRVAVTAYNLSKGKTKSCGCLQKEYATLPWDSEQKKWIKRDTRSKDHPKLYALWSRIRYFSKLPNIKCKYVDRLREKGIAMLYQPWKSFEVFEQWAVSNGWDESKNLRIQRRDKDIGWYPDNCIFASKEMGGFKAGALLYTYQGRTMCLSHWAKEFNMDYHTLQRRIKYCDGDLEKAIQIPKVKYPANRKSRKSRKSTEDKKERG